MKDMQVRGGQRVVQNLAVNVLRGTTYMNKSIRETFLIACKTVAVRSTMWSIERTGEEAKSTTALSSDALIDVLSGYALIRLAKLILIRPRKNHRNSSERLNWYYGSWMDTNYQT